MSYSETSKIIINKCLELEKNKSLKILVESDSDDNEDIKRDAYKKLKILAKIQWLLDKI